MSEKDGWGIRTHQLGILQWQYLGFPQQVKLVLNILPAYSRPWINTIWSALQKYPVSSSGVGIKIVDVMRSCWVTTLWVLRIYCSVRLWGRKNLYIYYAMLITSRWDFWRILTPISLVNGGSVFCMSREIYVLYHFTYTALMQAISASNVKTGPNLVAISIHSGLILVPTEQLSAQLQIILLETSCPAIQLGIVNSELL